MKFIPLVILFSIFFSGCNKKNNPEIQPVRTDSVSRTGALSLTVLQASNAVKFRIRSTALDTSILIGNTSNNVFLLPNLPAGQYNISVIPKLGYSVSANSQVAIHGGDTANAGTFILTANGSPGFLRFSLGNSPVRDTFDFSPPDVQCAYLNNTLYITTTQPTQFPNWYFDFRVSGVAAQGNYILNFSNTNSYVKAYRLSSATSSIVYTTNKYNTEFPALSGSVSFNISTLDTARNVVSGTFSGRVLQSGLITAIKGVSNGSFQLNY